MSVALSFASDSYSQKKPIGQSAVQGAVYVIDDMADRLRFVSIALEQAGYRALIKGSFPDFAREFQAESCEAIIIDVHLGDNDAIDVLDFLRRNNCKASLYLTSGDPNGLVNARRYAEEVGLTVVDCIPKPFSGNELVQRLRKKSGQVKQILAKIDLEEALRNRWIYPVLQPKLHLASGEIRSAELLSRMAHPTFGIVGPHQFIGELTAVQSQTLFLQHVAFVRKHFGAGSPAGEDFQVSVNVDPENLARLRNRIKDFTERVPDFYNKIVLELTEEKLSLISDDQLKALYKMSLDGARFSIDDFGTGLSNFGRLSRLPFCEIKIDRSIVQGCSSVSARKVMVKSIINMAHDLGATVVAEGVETSEDFTFLEENRCDFVQGYFVARPMKLEKFYSFLADFNTTLAAVPEPEPNVFAFQQL